ncbi:MAG: hypothetical protein Q9226_001493 [Calogaya cf. arnoldii]
MRRFASVLPRTNSRYLRSRCYSNSTSDPIGTTDNGNSTSDPIGTTDNGDFTSDPIISIKNATFYRQHPSALEANDARINPPIFPNLTFEVASSSGNSGRGHHEHWCVVGSSSAGKTTFLEVIRGQHLCFPPTARSYPYLSSPEIDRKDHRLRSSFRAIQYVGFGGKHGGGLRGGNTAGSYLSARYESRREATDFTVLDYLEGNIELNPSSETAVGSRSRALSRPRKKRKRKLNAGLQKVIHDLNLEELVDLPVSKLSNGQTRRAKIAKALLDKPELLLLDEPFMGLDPPTMNAISSLLRRLAKAEEPRIMLSLRPQDPLPEWINNVVYLGPELRVHHQGFAGKVLRNLGMKPRARERLEIAARKRLSLSRDGLPWHGEISGSEGEPIVEMRDIRVEYGDKVVLGNWQEVFDGKERQGFNWTVRRGQRWVICGLNGSGKTTLLSLICSDHPQSYSVPIRLFSFPRLPQPGTPGISIFDLQSRIGHSSPEIHNFFPKHLSLSRCIESAWSDTFLSRPSLTYKRDILVDTYLKWFEPELNPAYAPMTSFSRKKTGSQIRARCVNHGDHVLNFDSTAATEWADNIRFADLPFSAQRVALFLRALIKKPDLVVLDEAFSGMDDALRDKCLLFLTWGTTKVYSKSGGNHSRKVLDTRNEVLELEGVRVEGLSSEQALIVVSHVKEEVPGLVRDWVYLPEAGTGEKARFGHLDGPLEGAHGRWEEIWGMAE